MKNRACFLARILIAGLIVFSFLPNPLAISFEGQSSKTILDNGLTVVISEMPASPMVSVYGLVKTGSATEGKYMGTGVSHFLEHMLFKGTQKRKVGEIAAQIQAVGGNINASTGLDYTIYTITVPYEAFDIALDILSDMLMNSTMDTQELERERQVIRGEMRLHNDNPDRKLSELVFQTNYLLHPYKFPVIGYDPLFLSLTRDEVYDYYKNFYAPNNIVLSVAGHVKTEEILPKIKQSFGPYAPKRFTLRTLPVEPVQIAPRFYEEEYPTNLTRMNLSFSGVKLLDRDLYALDVLAQILGSGESSRLYLDVYKKRELVYEISASNFTPMEQGFFEIECLLEQKNAQSAAKAILENIDLIKKLGVTKEELDKAKRQVLSAHVLSQQTSGRLAYNQAIDEAYTGDYQFSQKYVDAVKQVSAEDIKAAAIKYLHTDAMTTVVLRPPSKPEAGAKPTEIATVKEIQKTTLDNGLTVLLREDHTFPIVSMRLALNGGTRQETPELNGLSSLTARAWLKGTKTRSAEEIARDVESLGVNFDSYSGKNSFGITLELLSENQDVAAGLLEDVVKNPIFPDDEIIKIKDIMRTEIKQRDDDIGQYTNHALKQVLFLSHPLRLEEEGTEETINRITRDNVVGFYEKNVAPNNMVLTVYGDINPETTLADIKKRFGTLSIKKVQLPSYSESPPTQQRQVDLTMDKEQAVVMIGFHGVKLSDPDYYGIEIMTSVLGSSFSGRLFNSIREQMGQAYTLGGDSLSGLDAGMVYFYVMTTGENVDRVKELVTGEIKKLQQDYVGDQELEDVKKYLKGNFRGTQETNASLSFVTGLDELYGLGYNNYKSFDQRIDQVTKLDVRRLALKYLDLNKMAVVITRPQPKSPPHPR